MTVTQRTLGDDLQETNSMDEGIMVDEAMVAVVRMNIIPDSLLDTVVILARGIIRRRDIQGAVTTTTVTEEEAAAINKMNINRTRSTVIDPHMSPIRVIRTDIMANRDETGSDIITSSIA